MKKKKSEAEEVLVVGDIAKNINTISDILNKQGVNCIKCKPEEELIKKVGNKEVFLAIIYIGFSENKEPFIEKISEVISLEIPHFIISSLEIFESLSKDELIKRSSDFILHPVRPDLLVNKVLKQRDYFERKHELRIAIDDIESKKKKIFEDQQKLKILTAAVSEPIIFVNQNLVVTFWNQEAQNMFGYSWYEAVSESFLHWLVAPKSHNQIKDIFHKANTSGTKQLKRRQLFTMRNKLKVEIEVEATISYHKLNAQEYNLVFVIHDKSKDKRLEKETLKSRELREENKLIREFVKHIGMDIQTPLNVLLGISDTLRSFDAENLTERQIEGLNILNQSGSHIHELVNDLWDISKLDSKKLKINNEPFDFDKVLAWHKSQTYQLIKDKSIKLFFKRSPSIPNELIGDARKINQVLTELLANAVRYTESGRIVLSSHFVESKLFFEITDTGKGIPRNILKNINSVVQERTTTDIKSSGAELGLYIAKKLVDLMRGELSVESDKEHGTVFRFYIPLSSDSKPPKPGAFLSDDSSDVVTFGYEKDTKLILVVDDSPESAFIYSVLAEDKRFSVLHVKNGKKAPAAIRDFAPDLLIIKMEMPGIHGASIVRELRNKLIKIPVIAVSQFDKLPSLASYNVQLISEPLSGDVLLNTIENKIRWFKKKAIKTIVVYEEESWIYKVKETDSDVVFINNKMPELSLIQIAQLNPQYLIFENVEKTTNSLPLLLKTIAELNPSDFKEIHLHYEGIPMKYLLQKIETFPNIKLNTTKEVKALKIL